MIIENPCNVHKKDLRIGISFYDFKTKKTSNLFVNPKDIESLILTRTSKISSEIYKLNPNLNILLFNNGKPVATINPVNKISKMLKNEVLFTKLSKFKRKRLAKIFCRAICSSRIKIISRLNETRKNEEVKKILQKMRLLDKKIMGSKNRNELMGIEGNIAKMFYSCLGEFNPLFRVKRDRFAKDMVNTLMNLSHTILRNKVKYRLILNGLNINHGFLHKKEDRYEDYLVWDFSEFWISYCDKLVFYALERGIIKKDDMDKNGRLKMMEKNKIIKLINTRINQEEIDRKIIQFIKYLKGEGKFNWIIN